MHFSPRILCLFAALCVLAGSSEWALAKDIKWKWEMVRADGTSGIPHRDSARSFPYNNRQWISNGYVYGGGARRDLYVSGSGYDWSVVNSATPYPAYSPIVPHDGKLFIVGPQKVQTTFDGLSFTTISETSPIRGYFEEAPIIGDFVASGETAAKIYLFLSDGVRYSENGTTWSNAAAPWDSSYLNYVGIAFNGTVYIMGGDVTQANHPAEAGDPGKTSVNHVWSSDKPEDPNSWVMTPAPWNARMWPSLAVHEDAIWMTGGYSNVIDINYSDTWRFDGSTWRKIWTERDYPSRHAATMYSMNGELFMVAGNRNPDVGQTMSDVWVLRPF